MTATPGEKNEEKQLPSNTPENAEEKQAPEGDTEQRDDDQWSPTDFNIVCDPTFQFYF